MALDGLDLEADCLKTLDYVKKVVVARLRLKPDNVRQTQLQEVYECISKLECRLVGL